MVNSFRSLLATALALLIASPLCCCAVTTPENGERSCCAASEHEKSPSDQAPHVCACHSKAPKDLAKDLELPGAAAVPLSPETTDLTHLTPPEPVAVLRAPAVRSGCDPPRSRLARLSRWLL